MQLSYDLAFLLLGTYAKEIKTGSSYVYCSIIHNSQDIKNNLSIEQRING